MNALALPLSLAALVLWALVFGGVVVHWRAGRTAPTGVIAAFMLAVTGAVLARLVGATVFEHSPPHLTDEAVLAAHFGRAVLVISGAWALVALVRSRRRW